jgi:hypothetical protein
MYFGMQFAQRFAGYSVAPCVMKTDVNVTAYLGTRRNQQLLAIVNKGKDLIRFEAPEQLRAKRAKRCFTLSGPSLSAKDGVSFAEKPVPTKPVEVAGYAAVLLEFE